MRQPGLFGMSLALGAVFSFVIVPGVAVDAEAQARAQGPSTQVGNLSFLVLMKGGHLACVMQVFNFYIACLGRASLWNCFWIAHLDEGIASFPEV